MTTVIHIKRKIGRPQVEAPARPEYSAGPPASSEPKVSLDAPIPAAHAALGDRLTEKHSAYWLDGHPASLDKIMLETNRIRQAHGMKQVGNKREWMV